MKNTFYILIVICSLLYVPISLAKEHSGSFTRRITTPLVDVGYNNVKAEADVTMRVNWKLWTLLGEPLVDSRVQWEIHKVSIKQGDSVTQTTTYHPCETTNMNSCLPASVFQSVDIIQAAVKIQTTVFNAKHASRAGLGMIVDLGIVSKPGIGEFGSSSFNIPISPNWNELFIDGYLGSVSKEPNYVGLQRAQKIFSSDVLKFKDAKCHNGAQYAAKCLFYKFDANFMSFVKAIVEKEQKNKLAKLKKSNDKRQKDENKTIRSNTQDDIFAEFEVEMLQSKNKSQLRKSQDNVLRKHKREIKRINEIYKDNLVRKEDRYNEIAARTLPSIDLEPFQKKVNGEWVYGYRNGDKKVVIQPKFLKAGEFSEGLAPVRTKRGYGYIDFKGNWIIAPQKNVWAAYSFSEGKALVKIDYKSLESLRCGHRPYRYKSYYINKKGKRISEAVSKKGDNSTICLQKEY
ncbi:WG repeat-containing protein [Shewanella gelidii]|uniref:WG repeat-containing protein n=1 Tax=Shewanella gelidii TaxID=1642821 RepID=A0A917JKR8_9GAMM|nr:WG repeat-containing protein [Shewanella gelidii]MCL1097007.1 WG repeat-containing protein [Shewanella gelidii]GGI71877.1 hypothetical protein GCM10009332_06550 [Shewanella gelidii]